MLSHCKCPPLHNFSEIYIIWTLEKCRYCSIQLDKAAPCPGRALVCWCSGGRVWQDAASGVLMWWWQTVARCSFWCAVAGGGSGKVLATAERRPAGTSGDWGHWTLLSSSREGHNCRHYRYSGSSRTMAINLYFATGFISASYSLSQS